MAALDNECSHTYVTNQRKADYQGGGCRHQTKRFREKQTRDD
jgi:hypothetical protein